MDQCSEYIAKLEGYRKKLNVMATAGKMNQLLEAVQSKKFIEQELTEFYTNFDSTFLQLFPDFIVQFELLLIDTELTERKDGELLNTELRIVALIRLGIKDSAKIATFLRYSVSTIYNYRSLLKNKSKGPREEFESKVLLIGGSKL
jgi:DNA-binding NarL/FixJ family response regulator